MDGVQLCEREFVVNRDKIYNGEFVVEIKYIMENLLLIEINI